MAENTLPNLNAGHLDGCVTEAVYPYEDTGPTLVLVRCAGGCPHGTVALPRQRLGSETEPNKET